MKTSQGAGRVQKLKWLTGWKDIATYFGVKWRTVKKWHKIYSMPVLRTPTGKPTNTPQELDTWMRKINQERTAENGKPTTA